MILKNTSSFFAADLALLASYKAKPSLWKTELDAALKSYERDLYTDDAIAAIQHARRLIRIFTCGLENSAALREQLKNAFLTDWTNFVEPPVPKAWQDSLAKKLYVVRSASEVPLLEIGDQARYIGLKLFDRCVAEKLGFDVNIHDDNFAAVVMRNASEAGIAALAAHFLKVRESITARIFVGHNLPDWPVVEADLGKQRQYRKLIQPWREKSLSGKMRSVLTSIPTPRDAVVDGIEYKKYAELYFRMCDQPWDLIKQAQSVLIEKLNKGTLLHFTNNDGTDFTLDIGGFTFCNSVIARNIPGSEVFSAPKIDSAQGLIVAKGRFAVKEEAGTIVENLHLSFNKGKLVQAVADRGQADLDKALSVDEGARRIGEIGIGTNPYLKEHLASILLSEKIGGSFHVALGDAYTMTDYMGDPVVVDNGNRSQLHWDITTMLFGKEGAIILDGKPIMQDGLFLDPALDVLNRGWQAVPFDARPPEWQKIYPDK